MIANFENVVTKKVQLQKMKLAGKKFESEK